jgi:hypothetical protein
VQVEFTLQFSNISSTYLKWIEPSWVSVGGGQNVTLALANLKANFGSVSLSDMSMALMGIICPCSSIVSDGLLETLTCLTPALPYNTSVVTVEALYRGQSLCSSVVVVNGQEPVPTLQFLGARSFANPSATVAFSEVVLELESVNELKFEISDIGTVGLEAGDIIIQLRPNHLTSCSTGAQSDCLRFKSSVYNLSEISIMATGKTLLQGSGILNLSYCPSVFCGRGGWGVDFDLSMFVLGLKRVEKQRVLRMIPKGTFSLSSLKPSTIPSRRSFVISATTDRYWNQTVSSNFHVEFRDINGTVRSGVIQKLTPIYGSNRFKITMLVPAFSPGPVLGRFFRAGDLSQRSSTVSTFGFFCRDDPVAPAAVQWASTTRGPASGGTTVRLILSNFPMIDSSSQVNLYN